MNVGGEGFDLLLRVANRLGNVIARGKGGGAQPVVAYHAVFVRIGDFASLDAGHGIHRLVQRRGHLLPEVRGQLHPGGVDGDAQLRAIATLVLILGQWILAGHGEYPRYAVGGSTIRR
jgi:hypothetical protein